MMVEGNSDDTIRIIAVTARLLTFSPSRVTLVPITGDAKGCV